MSRLDDDYIFPIFDHSLDRVSAIVALMFLLLLYPTGRLIFRRWRLVAWAAAAWASSGSPPWP